MAAFEQTIEDAIANEIIPGCVLIAANRDGSFKYEKAFGSHSISPPKAERTPLQPNNVMSIASCTKLLTSISVMQLAEQGKLDLDAPVYTHIPELKSYQIITGFNDDGSPILAPHTNSITARKLLTHTSGFAYNGVHPLVTQWCSAVGVNLNKETDLLARFAHPLVFEPGTNWFYGPSSDFAGLLVERVSGLSLEAYMKKNIWEPLGATDITFFLEKRPDMEERVMPCVQRDPETGNLLTDAPIPEGYKELQRLPVTSCLGGQGGWGSPESYFKVLHALLVADEDEKLLRKESVEEMFRPQLSEQERAGLGMFLSFDMAKAHVKPVGECDHGLGGMLLGADEDGGRSKGTLVWGGLPNLIFFVDRKAGLTGLFATQVLPFGDSKSCELGHLFELGIYDMYKKSKA